MSEMFKRNLSVTKKNIVNNDDENKNNDNNSDSYGNNDNHSNNKNIDNAHKKTKSKPKSLINMSV